MAGVTLLQLYYNYTNYTAAEAVFKRDTEKAFSEAIDSAFVVRNENIVNDFRNWLLDTTYVEISYKWDEIKEMPLFTIKELQPITPNGQNEISMNVEELSVRADSLTPEIKERFVAAMEDVIRSGLKKGIVWFFTQGIGQRLTKAHSGTPIDIKIIEEQYSLALDRKGIGLPFSLVESEGYYSEFCTDLHDIGVKDPGERQIQACFDNTELYLLKQLKWIIFSSMLLIAITLFCFWYTAKILLTQQKLNELKDDFISNMTHEIHTPLTSVIITAEALRGFNMTKQQQDSYIDIILHQSNKLAALSDDILTASKIDRKGIVLSDMVLINELIEEIVNSYKNNVVIKHITTGNVKIKSSRKHLLGVLSNLIENAIKYNDESPEVTIESRTAGRELYVMVADNGPGIPDECKQKIFDEFFRIPTGNVHNVKGYGLGLSYVRKIIKAHKGAVEVKDNYPKGSMFIITIPYEA